MAYIGVQPTDTYLSIASQQITGTGSATYTLNYSVSDEESVAVFVNNVRQNVSSYTVSGTSLTLGGTISASDECWVLFLGRTVGTKTPAVGSVTNDMLTGSIANAKLANSSITLNGSAVSLGGSANVVNTPLFKVRLASGQTISNVTRTVIAFDQVEIDTGSNWDNINKRYIPDEAGYYFFYTQVRISDSSDFTDFGLRIRKNGNASSDYVESNVSNWHYESNWCQGIWYMNGTTDYIDVTAYHNKGSNSGIDAPWYTWFQGFKLIGS
jgi:hypothetical protein